VSGKGGVVTGSVICEEHLRTDRVAYCPGNEVDCDDTGLFGLAGNVAREEGEADCCASLGGLVGVRSVGRGDVLTQKERQM